MATEVLDAMQTPDGAWRVEVVKRDHSLWYRIVNEDQDVIIEWLTITAVQRLLEEAGVDMAELVSAESATHGSKTPRAA